MSNRNLGQTILLITHDEKIALEADRIITIEDGKMSAIISVTQPNGIKVSLRRKVGEGYVERLFDRIHQKESGFQRIRSGGGVYFCSVSFFAVRFIYNFWNYEIESVILEEGNWQGRISGAFGEDAVSEIEHFANVKTAAINEDLSDEQTLAVDICFDDMRAVYRDMPLIAAQLGVPETSYRIMNRCCQVISSTIRRTALPPY